MHEYLVNIYYTGKNGSARKFAEEKIAHGVVDRIRAKEGNERYEYFFSDGRLRNSASHRLLEKSGSARLSS